MENAATEANRDFFLLTASCCPLAAYLSGRRGPDKRLFSARCPLDVGKGHHIPVEGAIVVGFRLA